MTLAKRYSAELRERALDAYRSNEGTGPEIAVRFGVPVSALYSWAKRAVRGESPGGESRSTLRMGARARTENMQRLSKAALEAGRAEYPEEYDRPKTRAECVDGPRPCGFCACRHHLALDINPWTGAVKLNFPDLDIDEMPETCSLDVADRGGETLQGVASMLNVVRERVRQIELDAVRKLGPKLERLNNSADLVWFRDLRDRRERDETDLRAGLAGMNDTEGLG